MHGSSWRSPARNCGCQRKANAQHRWVFLQPIFFPYRLPLWEKEKRLRIMQPLPFPRSIGLGLAPVVTLARPVRAFSQTEHFYSMPAAPVAQFNTLPSGHPPSLSCCFFPAAWWLENARPEARFFLDTVPSLRVCLVVGNEGTGAAEHVLVKKEGKTMEDHGRAPPNRRHNAGVRLSPC